jgi:hypothetical protein
MAPGDGSGAADGGIAGETLVGVGRLPVLRYLRAGADRTAPLPVFLSGAGHLARVAYGHRGSEPRDFLDHWLADAGFGLLALSYPCGPPATAEPHADLTLAQWAEAVAQAAGDALGRGSGPRAIVLLAWSMAARAAGLLARAAERRGIAIAAFMPMAASPPLPGLSSVALESEIVAGGMWDAHGSLVGGVPRGQAWRAELAEQAHGLGRDLVSPADYRDHYCVGTPVGLMPGREPAAACELAAFPLAASISPRDQADYRHALGDVAIWGFVNAQVIRRRWIEPALARGAIAPSAWEQMLTLMPQLPGRLNRHVAGGHLFFIGETGARATARAVAELLAATRAVAAELDSLLGTGPATTGGKLS